jgi:hypothetical protein
VINGKYVLALAELEVLSVRVAVCVCADPEKLNCVGLNVLVPTGAPKDANVTVPVKPFFEVTLKLYTTEPPGLMVWDADGLTCSV